MIKEKYKIRERKKMKLLPLTGNFPWSFNMLNTTNANIGNCVRVMPWFVELYSIKYTQGTKNW